VLMETRSWSELAIASRVKSPTKVFFGHSDRHPQGDFRGSAGTSRCSISFPKSIASRSSALNFVESALVSRARRGKFPNIE